MNIWAKISLSLRQRTSALYLSWILLPVAPFLVRLGFPKTLGFLSIPAFSTISFPDRIYRSKDSRRRVVFLNKSVFVQDVMEGLAPRGRFELVMLDRRLFKAIVGAFLPYEVHDNKYKSTDPKMETAKIRAREFLTPYFECLLRFYHFDAMITGNIVYWAEQEPAGVLDKLGVAFVACHKESVQAPAIYREMLSVRKEGNDKFKGTAVLVYNRQTRDQLVDGGMVDPDRIAVIGMPRLDRFHKLRIETGPQRKPAKVLCLMISQISQLRCLIDPTDTRRWKQISIRTHDELVRLAGRRPDIELVVKYKGSDQAQVDEYLKGLRNSLPQNVLFTSKASLLDLLRESAVVVGHNTTAIFEAMASGRKVLIPHYEEALLEEYRERMIDFGEGGERVLSPDQLIARVEEELERDLYSEPEISESVRSSLEKWVGNCDGESSMRMENGIMCAIMYQINKDNVSEFKFSVNG